MENTTARQAIEEQIVCRGITSKKLIKALLEIPREEFVPSDKKQLAWADSPVEIGYNSTISQPYIVALMTELMSLKGHEKVLEVGTGSGYQAAVLSKLAQKVFTIDIVPELTAEAKDRVKKLGLENIILLSGDGSAGYAEAAPYDAIMVTAGSPKIPQALVAQLKLGGKMLIPVGDELNQNLLLVIRREKDIETRPIDSVRFVPLIGRYAWRV